MSGGGGRHRGPIEMPKDDGNKFQIDRDPADLRPPDGKSAYNGPGMRSAVVHHVVTAFLIAMVLGVGTWAYLTFKNAKMFQPGAVKSRPVPFEIQAGDAQLERFRFALGVYFRIYDKYPPDLSTLVDEGLLATSDLDYPRGSSNIIYERKGDSYQLTIERTIVTVTEEAAGGDAGVDPDGGTAAQTNGAPAAADDEKAP